MRSIDFQSSGLRSLVEELSRPVERISIMWGLHQRPVCLSFWRQDGSGVAISSKAIPVAKRAEFGVLVFAPATVDANAKPVARPDWMTGTPKISKLLIEDLGVRAEAGLRLRYPSGMEIRVLSGVYQFTIAIDGLGEERPHVFEPEYPLEMYFESSM